ncbi:MAG TPA: cytidine deaminase [Vicinamibacterales bacterium]|nr:cytidine deaminase [Vicinamibacterales bacterium]
MSVSDPPESPRWPQGERRERARRLDDRAPAPEPAEPSRPPPRDRRSGLDRRDDASWEAVPLENGDEEAAALEHALITAARDARLRAHAHFSGFRVGAALATVEGQVVTGCNIENASYGLTVCAERVALLKALSDGHEAFTGIVVVADTHEPTPPCGPCRQLLWEYCGDIDVVLANLTEVTGRHRLSVLLPLPFERKLLKG